jgi:hypothetical protein
MQTALIYSPNAALSVTGVAMIAAFVVLGMRPTSHNPKHPR